MFNKDAIKEIAQSQAIDAANTNLKDGKVALPNDFSIHDLEKFAPTRRRARGTMTTSSVEDFAAYATVHKEPGASVFVQQDNMTAVAILNLGTPVAPGHADNRAKLEPKKTAAYQAMRLVTSGLPLTQSKAAEFLEDWPGFFKFFRETTEVTPAQAIAAVRKVTIEAMRKLESAEQQLSASRSAFESVQATSTEPLPTTIYFDCQPFHGLAQRQFVLRLGVITGGDKPAITLRVVNQEQHDEEMAEELAGKVRAAIRDDVPVFVGQYAAAS